MKTDQGQLDLSETVETGADHDRPKISRTVLDASARLNRDQAVEPRQTSIVESGPKQARMLNAKCEPITTTGEGDMKDQIAQTAEDENIDPETLADRLTRIINRHDVDTAREALEQEGLNGINLDHLLHFIDEYGDLSDIPAHLVDEPETAETVEQLKSIGGTRWRKYGKDRVYFNDLADRIGLDVERYNTGNVSSARLDGEKISNSKATDYLQKLKFGDFYYNVESGEFVSKDLPDWMVERIEESIEVELDQ